MSLSLTELNKKLVEKIKESLVYLFQGAGKFTNVRFSIGNIHGEEGDSLFVYLNQGRFKDSATGDHGDILELFSLKYGSKQTGIDQAYSFLGIRKTIKVDNQEKKKKIQWKKPDSDWSQLTENPKVSKYLTEERKLTIGSLREAGVKGLNDTHYVFISYTHDPEPVSCGANYISITRKVNSKTGKTKKIIHQSDAPLSVLYGHTSAKIGIKSEKKQKKGSLVITEGQLDMLSCRSQGILNSVSIPFGSGDTGWIENSWDWMMDKFDEFFLFFDNDDAGEELTEKVAKKIGYDRCKKCFLPAKYSDANEAHLDEYDLHKCILNALDFKPSKLISAGEIGDEAISILSKGRRELQGIPFMGWDGELNVNFRLRPKELTIYTGYPGHGKSNLLYQCIAHLVFCHGQVIVIASLEEDAQVILGLIYIHALALMYDNENKSRCMAFEAVKDYVADKVFFYHYRGQAKFADLLEAFEFTIRKYNAQHAVLDSVAKTDLNIEDLKESQIFISKVTDSMNATGAHYHLVAHSRKGNDRSFDEIPGLQQIKGDGSFGVQAFNCLTVWRNGFKDVALEKDKQTGGGGFKTKNNHHTHDDIRKKPSTILWINKQKVGGHTGQYSLYYDPECYRLHRTPDLECEAYAKEIVEQYIENPVEEDEDYE